MLAVGAVLAVGAGVSDLRPGQRVIAAPLYSLGAYAEQVAVDATHVFAIPDSVTDEHAAAITLNYGTAFAALHSAGRIRPGETIVVHAAAGGVGTAAIQLARLVDDIRIVGTASGHKRDHVLAQGADQFIDLCDRGLIEPHIDRVFTLDDAAEAHRYLHSRRSVGKLPLTV